MDQHRLLSTRETAERLSVCERTLHNLIARKQIKCVRVGRVLRFSPAAIAQFIEQNTHVG